MARFNLDDYETVEERLKRFWKQYPNGRVQTALVTTEGDRERKQWIVQSFLFRTSDPDEPSFASGLAFEIDGTAGANQTSALENAETSSLGRALANGGFSGNKRASREEMAKANRGNVTAMPLQKAAIDPQNAANLEQLNAMWAEAVATGQSKELQAAFTARKKELGDV